MAAAITLKDLLAGQERLKQQEARKNTTETMSMDEFRALQQGQTEGINDIEKAVASTTGNGLNANVVKMAKEIKKAMSPQARVAAQGDMYAPGAADRVKAVAEQPYHRGFGDTVKDFKKLGSLEGWFDTEGPSKGLLDDLIRKRKAKNEFIETNQALTGESKKTLGKRFDKVNQLRGQAQQLEETRKKYEAQGFSPEQIERTGINKKIAKLDQSVAIADPAYRERRANDAKVAEESSKPTTAKRDAASSFVAAAGTSKEKAAAPLAAVQSTVEGLVGKAPTEENAEESARAIGEQTQTLTKIEENTRGLAEGLAAIGAATAAKPAEAAAEKGGGILGDIASGAADMLGRGKNGPGKAAKGVGKLGKFAKIGGAALAVGAGAYTAYEGWSEASEKEEQSHAEVDKAVAEGKITPTEASTIKAKITDQADVAKGEAAGEGGGMVAGAAMGATVGTMVGGPVGTVVGGAIGAFAGSAAGKAIGGSLVSAYKGVKSWFSGDKAGKAEPVTTIDYKKFPIIADYDKEVKAGKLSAADALSAINNIAQNSKNPELAKAAEAYFGKQAGSTQLQQANAAVGGVKPAGEIVAGAPMKGAGVSQQMGLTAAGVERAKPVSPTPTDAEAVYGKSAENKAAEQAPPSVVNAPVVNAPTTNVQQTTNNTVRNPARNTESSQMWYNRSRFA